LASLCRNSRLVDWAYVSPLTDANALVLGEHVVVILRSSSGDANLPAHRQFEIRLEPCLATQLARIHSSVNLGFFAVGKAIRDNAAQQALAVVGFPFWEVVLSGSSGYATILLLPLVIAL